MHLPILNRFLIPLDGQTLHPLVTPAHTGQQTPNPAGPIAHIEQLPNHMSDTVQRPIILCISMSIGPLQQFPFQLLDLLFRQVALFSRPTFALFLRVFRFLLPAADASCGDSQFLGYFFNRFTTFQHVQGFLASFRKFFWCAKGSHAPIILQYLHHGHFYVKTQ